MRLINNWGQTRLHYDVFSLFNVHLSLLLPESLSYLVEVAITKVEIVVGSVCFGAISRSIRD